MPRRRGKTASASSRKRTVVQDLQPGRHFPDTSYAGAQVLWPAIRRSQTTWPLGCGSRPQPGSSPLGRCMMALRFEHAVYGSEKGLGDYRILAASAGVDRATEAAIGH